MNQQNLILSLPLTPPAFPPNSKLVLSPGKGFAFSSFMAADRPRSIFFLPSSSPSHKSFLHQMFLHLLDPLFKRWTLLWHLLSSFCLRFLITVLPRSDFATFLIPSPLRLLSFLCCLRKEGHWTHSVFLEFASFFFPLLPLSCTFQPSICRLVMIRHRLF